MLAHLGAMLAHLEGNVGPSWGYVRFLALPGGRRLGRRPNRLRLCHSQGAPGWILELTLIVGSAGLLDLDAIAGWARKREGVFPKAPAKGFSQRFAANFNFPFSVKAPLCKEFSV